MGKYKIGWFLFLGALFIAIITLAMSGCEEAPRTKTQIKTKIVVHEGKSSEDDGPIFWYYFIYLSDGSGYYQYKSETQTRNFTGVTFEKVLGVISELDIDIDDDIIRIDPPKNIKKEEFEQLEHEEVVETVEDDIFGGEGSEGGKVDPEEDEDPDDGNGDGGSGDSGDGGGGDGGD